MSNKNKPQMTQQEFLERIAASARGNHMAPPDVNSIPPPAPVVDPTKPDPELEAQKSLLHSANAQQPANPAYQPPQQSPEDAQNAALMQAKIKMLQDMASSGQVPDYLKK